MGLFSVRAESPRQIERLVDVREAVEGCYGYDVYSQKAEPGGIINEFPSRKLFTLDKRVVGSTYVVAGERYGLVSFPKDYQQSPLAAVRMPLQFPDRIIERRDIVIDLMELEGQAICPITFATRAVAKAVYVQTQGLHV